MWIEVVIEERKQLDIKVVLLTKYIESDAFQKMDHVQRGLLKSQLLTMMSYSEILKQRIEWGKIDIDG